MELITLSQRLTGQADNKLRLVINHELESVWEVCRKANPSGNSWTVTVSGWNEGGTRQVIKINWQQILTDLAGAIFEQRAPDARQKAIDEFLAQVEKLQPPTPPKSNEHDRP